MACHTLLCYLYHVAVSRAEVLPVGPPVAPEWQIGREGDIARLSASLRQGDHTVLADERRTGKTTVALAALEQLAKDERNVIVAVDLSRAIDDRAALNDAVALQVATQRSTVAGAPGRPARSRSASGTWSAEQVSSRGTRAKRSMRF
jgi:hypothetical protein